MHPVLLLQICEANNIDVKYLKEYVDNRDEHLKQVMNHYGVNRDSAKKLFIKLMYFGSFNTWFKEIVNPTNTDKLTFIHNFSLELNSIGHIILENNSDLKKQVEKRKDVNNNLIGSVVSYYLQEYENRILEAVYLYCVENKYIINNIAVLCADGLMIEEKYYKEELLNNLVELVYNQFNFKVKFTTKAFDQDYLNILDEHQIKGEVVLPTDDFYYIKVCCDGSHKDAAHLIIEDFKNKFISTGTTYYTYNTNKALWETVDDNFVKADITYLLQAKIDDEFEPYKSLDFNKLSDDDKIEYKKKSVQYQKANKLIGDPTNCGKYLTYLKGFIRDENFEEKLNRSKDYYLPVKKINVLI